MKKNSRLQAGFSLIELLLVLGILMILLVATFVIYPRVLGANLGNQEVGRFSATAAGLSAYYAEVPSNEPPPSADELLKAGVLVSGDFWNGQWVSLERNPIVLEAVDGAWSVSYTSVSPSMCPHFLSQIMAYNGGVFSAVYLDGKDITNAGVESLVVACDQTQKPVAIRFQLKHLGDGLARTSKAPAKTPARAEFVDPKGKTWGTREGM